MTIVRSHWPLTAGHTEFINEIEKIQREYEDTDVVDLLVDENLLRQYFLLDENTANQFLTALRKTPFTCVSIKDFPPHLSLDARTRRGTKRLTQCRRFFEVLGTIPTLLLGNIMISSRHLWSPMHGVALESLKQISSMYIFRSTQNTNDQEWHILRQVARCLCGHNELKNVTLAVPYEQYSILLPALQTMPVLHSVKLHCSSQTMPEDMIDEPLVTQAIADLLLAETSMHFLDVTNFAFQGDSYAVLCDAIARTKIKSLELCQCLLENAVTLPTVLPRSRLTEITLSALEFFGSTGLETETFFNAFATNVTSMSQLEKLRIDNYGVRDHSISRDEAFLAVVHAVARCPRLTSLDLDWFTYSSNMDQVLASCVRSSPLLETLRINCVRFESADHAGPIFYPLLSQVIEGSYCLRNVVLDPLSNQAQIFVKLNNAGRAYMATDSANQCKGIRVLAQVKDDPDCLFAHIRENPLVCKVRTATVVAGQKRKSTESDESASCKSRRQG
ncbi:hypothetical protein MPSEU_000551200 [Mayamaea pseudoterrestris]|nr:hypothetical protein MPSEU_000551200 [Mayamaea pseudoterrestris]